MTITMQGVESASDRIDRVAAMIFSKWWTDRYCHANGQISGKGVRRAMADIRRKSPVILSISVYDQTRRPLIDAVTNNTGRMSPNKIARMIRRNVARAEVQATRPLLAIKPNFAELRSVDGKDLDSAFRGQDES